MINYLESYNKLFKLFKRYIYNNNVLKTCELRLDVCLIQANK